jgi:hypothetical protein
VSQILIAAVLSGIAAAGCTARHTDGPKPTESYAGFCAEALDIQRANSTPVSGNLRSRLRKQLQHLVAAAPISARARLEPLRHYNDTDGGDERNPGQHRARQDLIRALDEECGLTVAIFEAG